MDPIHSKRHPGALSAWLPAALWLAAMLLVSVQSVAVTREMLSMVAGAAKGIMGAMVKDGLSAETADLVGKVACAGVVFLGYAVLALLLLRALRLRGTGPRAAYGLSLSGCVLFAVVAELFQVLIPGRQPTVGECALNIAASFVTLRINLADSRTMGPHSCTVRAPNSCAPQFSFPTLQYFTL